MAGVPSMSTGEPTPVRSGTPARFIMRKALRILNVFALLVGYLTIFTAILFWVSGGRY